MTRRYKPQFHSWHRVSARAYARAGDGPERNNIVPAAWKLRGPFRVQEPTTAFVLDLRVLSDCDDVHGRIWRRLLPDGPRPHIPSIFSTRRFGKSSSCCSYVVKPLWYSRRSLGGLSLSPANTIRPSKGARLPRTRFHFTVTPTDDYFTLTRLHHRRTQ